jgi:molybdenum cofactor cytidylyltransferase
MTAIIILAAGESSRLGQPKQNLVFHHKTLLQRALDTALEASVGPVIVVLGANFDLIKPGNSAPNAAVLYNPDWQEGMASAIRLATEKVTENTEIDNAVLMVCDQPFVDKNLILILVKKQQETGKAMVACTYNNTTGVPALFNRSLFPELRSLQGQEGAKKIFKSHAGHLAHITFDKGDIDVDTMHDYELLLQHKGPDNN